MEGTWIARAAVRYMEEHRNDPFALWVSFMEPHSPFRFRIEDRGKYDPSSFPVPALGPDDASQIPLIFRDLSPADKQGIIAAYYTSVDFHDRNVGYVLDGLKRLKLENDTLVIYMADHGYSLGQHGRFEKHTCYEPALRVPLVFRWPGRVQKGAVIREFTESIDVPPTLLEMLGTERFDTNHGVSLSSYLRAGKSPAPRQSIFSEYLENEEACVRTSKWKFVQCHQPELPMAGREERFGWLKQAGPMRQVKLRGLHKGLAVRLQLRRAQPAAAAPADRASSGARPQGEVRLRAGRRLETAIHQAP